MERAARQMLEPERAPPVGQTSFGWFQPARPAVQDERSRAPPAGPSTRASAPEAPQRSGDLATDTAGELVLRYEFVGQRAEQLVSGDLLIDPRFGLVRITRVVTAQVGPTADDWVQLRWMDPAGCQTAALTVAAVTPVVLRVADRRDRQIIERAIDQARYFDTNLSHRSARLIAAHLQPGPASGLYDLALSGVIRPATVEELAVIARSRRPYISRWARALRAYCQQRSDHGPLLGLENQSQ